MKVKISKLGRKGEIEYSEETQQVSIQFPDALVADEIEEYLSTARIYRIPESQKIDDFREESAKPTDSLMHMELALCALWSETGVMVEW